MKILVIGPKRPYFFETACARQLTLLGCHVEQVDNKPRRWWLGNRPWHRLSAPGRIFQDLLANQEIYKFAKAFHPDIVFFCKAENVRSELFTLLKRDIKCKIVAWYVDNPLNATVSSYQSLRAIQKTDHCFIWGDYLIDALYAAGARSAHLLPFAYDPSSYPSDLPLNGDDTLKWKSDVCFVGTWDRVREAALEPLTGQTFDLAIYGQGWDRNLSSTSPLRSHVRSGAIWLEDTVKAYKGSHIALNLLRRHNWKGHNFRTMEVTGVGGATLATPWTKDQAEILFDQTTEILCFRGEGPTAHWVHEQLASPEQLRDKAAAAQQRVFREHLLEHRLRQLLEVVA